MRTSRPVLAGLTAASLLVGLTACGDDDDATPSTPSVTQVATSTTGGGSGTTTEPTSTTEPLDAGTVAQVTAATLSQPIALVTRAGDAGHVYVAERAGRVWRLAVAPGGEQLTAEGGEVLDITDQTSVDAERGLLDIAFSADGATLYVSSTDTDGNTRLASYEMDGNEADTATFSVRYRIDQPYSNHNGGHIQLGPDGKLWFGLGDGGSADDPENRAQDPSTDLGKILRFDTATWDREVVVTGVRNPWRFDFDEQDRLWVADVGQSAAEEITLLGLDEAAGANLGWSGYEGTQPTPGIDPEGRVPADPVMPIFEYSHDNGNCSITGGVVYRGAAMPWLQGAFLFADYCAGAVRAVFAGDDGSFARELDLDVEVGNPISFGEDETGEVFVLSEQGDVVRLIPGD